MAQQTRGTGMVTVGKGDNRFVRMIKKPVRLLRSLTPLVKLLIVVLVLGLVGVIAAVALTKDKTKPAPKSLAQIQQEVDTRFEEDKKRAAEAANKPTPEQQFVSAQKAVDGIKDPNNSQQSLQTYIDAALTGARVNSPSAKDYAAKALALYPTDKETRAMNAGQITRLEFISKGDYVNGLH